MRLLRWLLVVPAGLCGALAGFLVALTLHTLVTRSCPQEAMVSGACTASWFPVAEQLALCAGAIVGALGAVGLPALAAPAARTPVALAACALGATYSVWAWLQVGALAAAPAVAALGAGAVAACAIHRRGSSTRRRFLWSSPFD